MWGAVISNSVIEVSAPNALGPFGLRGRGWNRGALIFDADLNGIPDVFLPSGNSSHSNPKAPDYKTYYWRSMMTAIKDHHTDSGDEDNQKEMVEAGQFVGSFGGYRSDELLLGQPDRFVSLGALLRASPMHGTDAPRHTSTWMAMETQILRS